MTDSQISIRAERPSDIASVHAIHCEAFETDAEAGLVDALRAAARPLVSLVAEREGQVVGHILFTPVSIGEHAAEGARWMGLAPMAVESSLQRQGVGTLLVEAGLEACRGLGTERVIVLGHPEYYPRFGFTAASDVHVRYGPDDRYGPYFFALDLVPGVTARGEVVYHEAFAALGE